MATSAINILSSLAGVSDVTYSQAEAYAMQLLREQFPDQDFGYGRALYWTVVVPMAAGMAANLTNSQLTINSLYLKALRDAPEQANEDLAALLLSNYYTTTTEGATSSGTVAVVVSTKTNYALPAGTVFTSGALKYVTTQAIFVYTTSAEVAKVNDRLLTQRSDGYYQFLVPVVSAEVGVATFLPASTVLELSNPPASYIKAVAASDLSGGKDAQTFADLVASIPETFGAQVFGGRTHIASLIEKQFPGTKTAVVGFGDPEMTRDTHNLMGVQSGGMVDLYVATQTSIETVTETIEAELIDVANKTWRFTVPADIAPGVYAVLKVVPEGYQGESLVLGATTRGFTIPTGWYDPKITTSAEAAFSVYQTLVTSFTDSVTVHTGLVAGAKKNYDVMFHRMPLVSDIHDLLVDNGHLTMADKVLVRGAVPCLTTISMSVRLLDADFEADIDVTAMKRAIINRVYGLGFNYGVLSSSIVMDAVHGYLTGRSDVGSTSVTLRGDIYAPSGDKLVIMGQEIRIPTDAAKMVSKKNTIFLTDSSRIDIQFTRVEA